MTHVQRRGTQGACASGIPANQSRLYLDVEQTRPADPLSGRRFRLAETRGLGE